MSHKQSLFKSAAGSLTIVFLLCLWVTDTQAYQVYTTSNGGVVKWDTTSETYFINTSGGPSGTLSAIQSAMQTWTSVATSSFEFIYGGDASSSCGIRDGVNGVCFGSMGSTGTLAKGSIWYDLDTGQILETDIKFNTDYNFKTDGSADAYDVQNIATHELGHSLGLADLYGSSDSDKTMYGYAAQGETKKRTLSQDDMDGITYLYPSGYCTYKISPTIAVFSSSGGTGTVSVVSSMDCGWTAVSNSNWITITSGDSGTGSGMVYYSVPEYSGTSSRSGTMTIAGETVEVSQNSALESGTQRWAFTTGADVFSSPAIGSDGTIYVGSLDHNLYAINPDGTQKWAFPTLNIVTSSPAIGSDGTIYIGSLDNNLYAINPDGTQKWAFPTGAAVNASPAIGPDGTIYAGSLDNNLYAINPDGTQKWAFPTGGGLRSSPAIGLDGTIFVGSYDYNLYAVNPDGTQKWAFPTLNIVMSSPALGSDGTIYLGSSDKSLYAINPDGTQKWALPGLNILMSSPAIGLGGTLYVGSANKNLYAINPDGTLKWAFPTGGDLESSPAVGSDGTIYAGSGDSSLYAINPDGTQKWAFRTGNSVDSSPAVGPDGTIYVGSRDFNLYAIYGSPGGLANSDWPMFHHDLRHAGVVSFFPSPDIKANGYNGSITVLPGTPVSISIGLNACYFDAQNADWWMVELAPSGEITYFDLSTGSMEPGFLPTYQGPLFDFGDTQVLSFTDLTAGAHIFCFGVDLNMNGSLDGDSLYYGFVTVNVAD